MLRLVRDGVALIAGAQGFGVTLERLMLHDCHVDAQGRLWLARISHGVAGQNEEKAWAASQDWFGMSLKMSRDKTMSQKVRAAFEQSSGLAELLVRLSVV